MSRRTCSAVRSLLVAIVPQRLARQLRLADRLLGCERRSFLERHERQAPSSATSRTRMPVTISRAAQTEVTVAIPAAAEASPNPSAYSSSRAAPQGEADPEAERGELALDLERSQLELEPRERACVLGDLLGRGAEPEPRAQSRGWAWPLQSSTFAATMPATRAAPTNSHGDGPPRTSACGSRSGPAAAAGRSWRRPAAARRARRRSSRRASVPRSGSASACAGRRRRPRAPRPARCRLRRRARPRGRRGDAGPWAPRSTRRSALVISSSAVARRSRPSRSSRRLGVRRSSRRRRARVETGPEQLPQHSGLLA